jgi:transcriptional regulator with PAS, ATPase and Fis domain
MRVIRVGNTMEIPIDVRVIATTNKDVATLINTGKFREDLFFRLNVFPIEIPSLRERKDDIPFLVDHFLSLFKLKYKYDKKALSTDAMNKLLNYDWPGNIRQLQHLIERAILFSGKDPEIGAQHLKLEQDLPETKNTSYTSDDVIPLAEMEKKLIYAALKKTNDHRTQAAELLGITVRTLRNKLHQFEDEKASE